MGLRPAEYYRLTPVEFSHMYSAHISKSKERKKELRLLSYFIVKGWVDPKGFPDSPEAWWPIDDEDQGQNKGVDLKAWSQDKKDEALRLIQETIGG